MSYGMFCIIKACERNSTERRRERIKKEVIKIKLKVTKGKEQVEEGDEEKRKETTE